jgi:SWI/SNF-related matrix-associated actin-dependent regulator of chromatin subfamily A member 5
MPSARVVKLIATKDEREEILSTIVDKGKFDILVTSFEGVRICLNSLKKIKWHYIVIDEAHKIKNEDSQLSQVVRKLHTECKLLLTGTPLQNNLHELWSLLNFLLPEIFSNSELFDNWFYNTSEQKVMDNEQEIERKNIQMIGQLHKILKPFMLRRTKLEVEKNLPVKKEVHIYVGLTEVQLKIYKNLLQNRNASEDEKKYYLNLLMQLRKVCNHPYLFPGIELEDAPSMGEHLIETSGKLIILDQLLTKLYAEGNHKVLIFSQMTMVLDILEDYCNYRLYKYCRIDGSTDMNSRDSQIEQFMAEGSDRFIFLLSTRAGGLGINLTAADTVVIYDSDFNPQMDLQAMDRAHRIGQKNMVNVYRLITENTVEEKIVERQMIKLKWDSLVIQQQKNSQKNKALTKEEMKDMLQYGANFIFKATNGTMTDELIDDILVRGESKTNALNKEVEDRMKNQQNNLVDFSMNSINIFDFMQQD